MRRATRSVTTFAVGPDHRSGGARPRSRSGRSSPGSASRRASFTTGKKRFGQVNEHNGLVPRDHWLEPHERQATLDFHQQRPDEGYRRLTYMMLDADIVAVSAASVYRVLKTAGRLARSNWAPSHSPTARWNAGTSHSRRKPSDRARRSLRRTPSD